ncbi:ABC transporter [Neobacillus bataviensis LMG 21833]|uniref:ABC transporter n=1 Tax=Neobacillus bataviensis LMG 21833 TaxID=1117379 RepID=K6C240_9BACI|nr:GldG family protein [Neobacillus bataviensis]EKN65215.1 ABC transporter [Neobacillus bataviensis LMG 21833]
MKEVKKITDQSRKRNLKYGSLSLAFLLVVIAIVIILNLFVAKFDQKFDFTNTKVFTLSKETKTIVTDLKDEVTIIVLEKAGSERSTNARIVGEYQEASSNITVQFIDPELNPNLLQEYGDDSNLTFGSIIVENGGKVKTLSPIDFVTLSKDQSKVKEIATESKITSAILSVTAKGEKVIYTTVGHGEEALNEELKQALENENYIIEEINLLTDTAPAAKESVVVINSLKKDISEEEAAKLKEYMSSGGKLLVIDDLYDADRKNYENILKLNGVQIQRSIVFENDMTHRLNSDKYVMIPEFGKHRIVDSLQESNYKAIVAYGQPIEILHVKKDNLLISPLLSSSKDSYSKLPDDIKVKRDINQEADDPIGPFHLGVVISKKEKGEEQPAMVLYSNSFFLNENLIKSSNKANLDMFVNSVNWLQDAKEQIVIRPKDISSSPIVMNNYQQILISIAVIFFIPLLIATPGFLYWYRRQKK